MRRDSLEILTDGVEQALLMELTAQDLLYRHFGKSLPHSSYAQRNVGRRVSSLSKAKPGDIICYSGHVAIYMGNNRVIHASNPRDGIKITKGAAYRSIVTIRRIF